MSDRERNELHWPILISLVAGIATGLLVNVFQPDIDRAISELVGRPGEVVNSITKYLFDPLGQIFLNLLFMTVVPLVFASLALGIGQLGDWRQVGRLGLRTLAFFVASMLIACGLGLTLMNWWEPGLAMPEPIRAELLQGVRSPVPPSQGFSVDTIVNLVPKNPIQAAANMEMLPIIFFALMVGLGLTWLPPGKRETLFALLQGANDVMVAIIWMAMRLAPVAVFALVFTKTAHFGLAYLQPLAGYVGLTLVGLALHQFVVLGLLIWWLGGVPPWVFFRKIWTVMITAFSTSSSNATLPTTLRTAQEELGVSSPVAGLVIPLGATMNMNGAALYEGATVLFLAQMYFGATPDWSVQMTVMVLAVLTAIGAAGVPGGSLPLLAMVLSSIGVPGEYLGVILGVDRLLDMARTVVNVSGDLVAAVYADRAKKAAST